MSQIGDYVRGQWALVIRRAAAVERAIMHLRGEGIKAPLRARHWNDVLVRQQQHGALGAVTLEARHDAGAARDRFENLVGNALALEDDGEVGGNLRLVTGGSWVSILTRSLRKELPPPMGKSVYVFSNNLDEQ